MKTNQSLIPLTTVASSVLSVLSLDNGVTISNPYDIASTHKNYYSHKYFSNCLSNESDSTIFLQPTDKEKIAISYPLSSLVSLLAQVVYLIEYNFF